MPDDDPISDGHDAALQVATIGSTLLGELSRRGATRTLSRADAATRAEAATRSQQAAREARAAARWAPILDRVYRSHATTREALDAWFAAEPRSMTNPQAARATALAETRLRHVAPGMMRDYDTERALGTERLFAMQRVVPPFDVPDAGRHRLLDDLATALNNRARTEEGGAQRLRTTTDDPATPRVDEHQLGLAFAVRPALAAATDRTSAAATTVAAQSVGRGTVEFSFVITSVPVRAASPAAGPSGPTTGPVIQTPRRPR